MLELECALTLDNATRMPAAGRVRFGGLPPGWQPIEEPLIDSIPPGCSRRVKLLAHVPGIPGGSDGVFHVPLELSTDDGLVRQVGVRASSVTALPLAGSVRIDGDLSDWPLGTTNVLSDFTLISGSGRRGASVDRSRPRRETLGFVLRDADNLYVAINCAADPELVRSDSRRNRVPYEDMIPMAGELIEVLIDPTNAGARSPSDLYHIVVMHSGADLAEKGIRFDPPCGLHHPWAVDMEVATSIAADRWMVEIRVPLDAFAAYATNHTVWGFNITRFDGVQEEFSTWSGAVHNAYDPLSLGNLILP
jgi:hypothetical protein